MEDDRNPTILFSPDAEGKCNIVVISNFDFITDDHVQLLGAIPIKCVHFERCRMTSYKFYQMLLAISGSVDTICIESSEISDNATNLEIPDLQLPYLTRFQATNNGNLRFIKHLKNTPILNFINLENAIDFSDEELTEILTFLASQSKLTELCLCSSSTGIFRKREMVEKLKFQLKKFIIDGKKLIDLEMEILRGFLKKQALLRTISLMNMKVKIDLMKVIFNDLKVQELIFSDSVFEMTDACEKMKNFSIEVLSLTFCVGQSFSEDVSELLKTLPNLRSIHFLNFTRDSLTGILETLKCSEKLRMIEFSRCQLPAVELMQIEKAEFWICQKDDVQKFLETNKCLTEYTCKY